MGLGPPGPQDSRSRPAGERAPTGQVTAKCCCFSCSFPNGHFLLQLCCVSSTVRSRVWWGRFKLQLGPRSQAGRLMSGRAHAPAPCPRSPDGACPPMEVRAAGVRTWSDTWDSGPWRRYTEKEVGGGRCPSCTASCAAPAPSHTHLHALCPVIASLWVLEPRRPVDSGSLGTGPGP